MLDRPFSCTVTAMNATVTQICSRLLVGCSALNPEDNPTCPIHKQDIFSTKLGSLKSRRHVMTFNSYNTVVCDSFLKDKEIAAERFQAVHIPVFTCDFYQYEGVSCVCNYICLYINSDSCTGTNEGTSK